MEISFKKYLEIAYSTGLDDSPEFGCFLACRGIFAFYITVDSDENCRPDQGLDLSGHLFKYVNNCK